MQIDLLDGQRFDHRDHTLLHASGPRRARAPVPLRVRAVRACARYRDPMNGHCSSKARMTRRSSGLLEPARRSRGRRRAAFRCTASPTRFSRTTTQASASRCYWTLNVQGTRDSEQVRACLPIERSFLLPDDAVEGKLETLLEQMAPPSHRAVYGCFDNYQQCLRALDRGYTSPDSKARVYAYCGSGGCQDRRGQGLRRSKALGPGGARPGAATPIPARPCRLRLNPKVRGARRRSRRAGRRPRRP